MRGIAALLLLLMAILYLLAAGPLRGWTGSGYLRAFAEAAMVGGVADWFAVTALFRHPLGMPIPHTALVPRSRARIGAAFGRFFAENFLTAEVLEARLQAWEFAGWGAGWLRTETNARSAARTVATATPALVRAIPPQTLEALTTQAARAALTTLPVAPLASTLLEAAWRDGRAEAVLDWTAARLAEVLEANEALILQKVQAQSWRWMPGFVDRAIARKITAAALQLLTEVREPGHPWREALGEWVQRWIARLAEDPGLARRGEAWRDRLLASPAVEAQLRTLAEALRARLDRESLEGEAWTARLTTLFVALGGWLEGDAAAQALLNGAARTLLIQGVAPRRDRLGRWLGGVVEAWDAESLVDRLELLVGPDLQYIRLNGTLVGGLVGLALYAASHAAGLG